jgi:hypothetical protein
MLKNAITKRMDIWLIQTHRGVNQEKCIAF